MYTLGIETSCDDTSLALVNEKGQVRLLKKWTADEDHIPFGGIVPERASRNHLKSLTPLLKKLLDEAGISFDQVNAIAVTNRPGLLGSLIVGVVSAQTLSLVYNKPLIAINHLEGHMYSPWLIDEGAEPLVETLVFPQVCLIVSGGHTQIVYMKKLGDYEILGSTRDDAVGEALDKFSNVIGLGFPGGPKVDSYAQKGDPKTYDFPRPMIKEEGYSFSFSGLKAAGARLVEKRPQPLEEEDLENLCASYLEAAVDVLVVKLKRALLDYKPKVFSVVGGVSANSRLRKRLQELSEESGVEFRMPLKKYCADNGAMIALAGALRFQQQKTNDLEVKVSARSLPEDFS